MPRLYLPWPRDSGTVAIVTSDGRMIVVSSHVHVNTASMPLFHIYLGEKPLQKCKMQKTDSDFRYIAENYEVLFIFYFNEVVD